MKASAFALWRRYVMAIGDLIAPRVAFGEALLELGARNPKTVVFDADVGESTFTALFGRAYPERFYQMGIAEANMVSAAAGMSTLGLEPWVSTFAVFIAKRAVDQVRISVAYPKTNVKLNGAYGGLPTGNAGATHQSVEDLAVMRAMPHMTVVTTADAVETRQAVLACSEHVGPLYLRTVRDPVPVIFGDDYRFQIGRSHALRQGGDVIIIATGMMTSKALDATTALASSGVAARVIHMPTIKPIDEKAIVRASQETAGIVTIENHSRIGGLGGAVAEVLTEQAPCRLIRLGFPDVFGESGDVEAIFTKFGMNTQHIVSAAKDLARSHRER
jgi:transketolase